MATSHDRNIWMTLTDDTCAEHHTDNPSLPHYQLATPPAEAQ